ncbi:MAG TPA: radical SAM protein [Syntrophorhabdales bacterium]|nr:radical SAM protein [Syntrophorhabdales bacterium]
MNLPKVRTETRGNLVRNCPGTRNHICCGYKTIDLVEGCMLSCSYCVLRAYLNGPSINVHDDTSYILAQVDEMIDAHKGSVPRFGTGELGDSLALERELGLHRPLIEFFGRKKRALLELKSKWASIRPVEDILNPYTVVSFSLAPASIVAQEERRTSPVHRRLKVLKRAQELGVFVGLHFDPIIMYPGFEQDYAELINEIARTLDLKRVLWVSMGLLRFMPRLYTIFLLEQRRNLLHGEFIRGEDGKYRYLKSERIRVYKMLYDQLKSKEGELFIYLCMERPDVWLEGTGVKVTTTEELIRLFDARIKKLYGGAL